MSHAAWHQHAARRHLSHGRGADAAPYEALRDLAPAWVPRQRATQMPDIALGTRSERRAKARTVTARLRAARACGPCGLNMPGEGCICEVA